MTILLIKVVRISGKVTDDHKAAPGSFTSLVRLPQEIRLVGNKTPKTGSAGLDR